MIEHTTAELFLPQQKNVDLLLTDPPYGQNWTAWDKSIDSKSVWQLIHNCLAENATVVMTAQQPFASELIQTSPLKFRQELIWEKPNGTGQVKYGPNRVHENILIWVRGKPVYNPQMTEGKPYTWNSVRSKGEASGWSGSEPIDNPGVRHPRSVMRVKQQRGLHPTQKPVELFEWLIHSYSTLGDTVCDPYSGSGTTAVACVNTGRQFLGCEQDEGYCLQANQRIAQATVSSQDTDTVQS